jgi:hypothetical protein
MEKGTNGYRAKFEAYLGNYVRFGSYLGVYHQAFKALMKDVEETGGHVDRLAYPMLFLARHCLELGFKANIRYFKKYSERNEFSNSDSHNLKDLFNGFKLHVREATKNLKVKYDIEVENSEITEFNEYCKKLETLTVYFDEVDRGSFSFRYPVDKENKEVFKFDDRVNLLDIDELLDEAMVLLNHTSDVFGKYTDYANSIEQMYEAEMRSAYGQ